MIGAQRAVIGQPRPGDRGVLLPHAEKATEAEHGIGDVAADLVDHQPLDGADLLAAGAADRRAFDPVARDQAVRLLGRRVGLHGALRQSNRVKRRSVAERPIIQNCAPSLKMLSAFDHKAGPALDALRNRNALAAHGVPIGQNRGATSPTWNGPRNTVPSLNRSGNATAGLPSSTVRWPSAETRLDVFWRSIPPSPGMIRSSALSVAPIWPSDMMRSMSNILSTLSMPTTVTCRLPSSPPRAVSLSVPAPTAITSSCCSRA